MNEERPLYGIHDPQPESPPPAYIRRFLMGGRVVSVELKFWAGDRVRWSRAWLRTHVTDLEIRRTLEGRVGTVFAVTHEDGGEKVRVVWRVVRERCPIETVPTKKVDVVSADQLEHVAPRPHVEGAVPQLNWMDVEHAARAADDNFLYQWERGGQFTLSPANTDAWLDDAELIRGQEIGRPALYQHGIHWIATYTVFEKGVPVRNVFYYVGLVGPEPEDDDGGV